MKIRPRDPADDERIRKVTAEAFAAGPRGLDGEDVLVDALRADGDLRVDLVAEDGGEVVGHVACSRMRTPENVLGLGPVSVVPEKQGVGIGSALMNAAIEQARLDGWSGIVLLGYPEYYARFGFSAEAAAGFETPFAGPNLMGLALSENMPVSGSLRYARAFGD